MKGSLEAIEKNRDGEFVVVPACEVTTNVGDILGYFLRDEVNPGDAFDVIDDIKAVGGIAVLAHPYKRTSSYPPKLLKKLDALEGFNARIGKASRLQRCWNLAKTYGLPMTGGSDAHFYFEIGHGITMLRGAVDLEDLRRGIERRETKLIGTLSSWAVEPASQTIKMLKTRNPWLSVNVSLSLIRKLMGREQQFAGKHDGLEVRDSAY